MATMSATMKQFTKSLKTTFEPMQTSLSNIEHALTITASREQEIEAQRAEKEKLEEEKNQTTWLKKLFGKKDEKGEGGGFITKHWGKILAALTFLLTLLPKSMWRNFVNPQWWKDKAFEMGGWILAGIMVKSAWDLAGLWIGAKILQKIGILPKAPVKPPPTKTTTVDTETTGKQTKAEKAEKAAQNKKAQSERAKNQKRDAKGRFVKGKITKVDKLTKGVAKVAPKVGKGLGWLSVLTTPFVGGLRFLEEKKGGRFNIWNKLKGGDGPWFTSDLAEPKSTKESSKGAALEMLNFLGNWNLFGGTEGTHATRDKEGTIDYGKMHDEGLTQRKFENKIKEWIPFLRPDNVSYRGGRGQFKITKTAFGTDADRNRLQAIENLKAFIASGGSLQSLGIIKSGKINMVPSETRETSWTHLSETSKAKTNILARFWEKMGFGTMHMTSGYRTVDENIKAMDESKNSLNIYKWKWQNFLRQHFKDTPGLADKILTAGKNTDLRRMGVRALMNNPAFRAANGHLHGNGIDIAYPPGKDKTNFGEVKAQIQDVFPGANVLPEKGHLHIQFDPAISPEDIRRNMRDLQEQNLVLRDGRLDQRGGKDANVVQQNNIINESGGKPMLIPFHGTVDNSNSVYHGAGPLGSI